jgi:hypothetical protein
MVAQDISWSRRASADWEAAESPSVRAAGGARFLSLLGDAFGSCVRGPLAVPRSDEGLTPVYDAAGSRRSGAASVPPGGNDGALGDRDGRAPGPAASHPSRATSINHGNTLSEEPVHGFPRRWSLSKGTVRPAGETDVRALRVSKAEPQVERGPRTGGEAAVEAEMRSPVHVARSTRSMSDDSLGTSGQSAVIFATLLHAEGDAEAEKPASRQALALPARTPGGGPLIARSGVDVMLEAHSSRAETAYVEPGAADLSALPTDEALKGLIQRLRAGAISVARVGDSWQFRGNVPGLGAVDIHVGRDGQGALNGMIRVAEPAAMELALSMTRTVVASPLRADVERIRWKIVGPNGESHTLAAEGASPSLAQLEES